MNTRLPVSDAGCRRIGTPSDRYKGIVKHKREEWPKIFSNIACVRSGVGLDGNEGACLTMSSVATLLISLWLSAILGETPAIPRVRGFLRVVLRAGTLEPMGVSRCINC